LESVCRGNSTVGSNPTLSARSSIFLTKTATFALAERLGVPPAYMSLLESSRRSIPARLVRQLVSVVGLPASTLPVSSESAPFRGDDAAHARGALGYTGSAHLRRSRRGNPAELLLQKPCDRTTSRRES
jgi:hypothetical protein